ncbi:DNA primase [Mycobacterium phage Steamy]|uniref:DNA primase n=1 Tax=Mycobacterium phage Steamy TaxID=2250309 RepID=A0A345L0R5_9CAUD|nr:DNA primase [Mycobacterium phage Steamy]AXH48867.1 DNA primase [Mycobacterium phage Steamy]
MPLSIPRRGDAVCGSQLRPPGVQLHGLQRQGRRDLNHPTRREGGDICRSSANRRGTICGKQHPGTAKACQEAQPQSIWRAGEFWTRHDGSGWGTWSTHSLVMRCTEAASRSRTSGGRRGGTGHVRPYGSAGSMAGHRST